MHCATCTSIKSIKKVAVIFYSSIFNESESKSCSIQFISCLILTTSDCECAILDWPWLIWFVLAWLIFVWLIFGWLIIEWLEDVWLILTAVTSGCVCSGLLLSWFPKAFWPSLEGKELSMVQWCQMRSNKVKRRSIWRKLWTIV